jgi:hypothetical protein
VTFHHTGPSFGTLPKSSISRIWSAAVSKYEPPIVLTACSLIFVQVFVSGFNVMNPLR